jgi:hypothetical protein
MHCFRYIARMYLGVCHEEILLFYAEDDRFSAACVPRDIARVNANEEGSVVPRFAFDDECLLRYVQCGMREGGELRLESTGGDTDTLEISKRLDGCWVADGL